MLASLAHGEDAFLLVDSAGHDVGWVRPKTIGFGGFVSEDAARAAAIDGARTLGLRANREQGEPPSVRTVELDDGEWVVDGPVRIARVLRLEKGDGEGPEFAIEFWLPPHVSQEVASNLAQIVCGALSRESHPRSIQATETYSE